MVATDPTALSSGAAGMRRTAALDGLRGLAILIVLASHFSNVGFAPQPGASGIGKAGVYLFFVLSAFLLTDRLATAPAGALRRPDAWIDYTLRRVLRIWPLYLLVLLTSWFLTTRGIAWHYVLDTPALMRHLALQEGRSVLWSIPVEFTFYAVLPALALLVRAGHQRQLGLWTIGLVGAGVLITAHVAWPPGSARVNDVSLAPYLPVFVCGVLAAALYARLPAHTAWSRNVWAAMGLLSLAGFVLTIPAVWAWASGAAVRLDMGHRWFLGYGLLWASLLLALLKGPAWLARPFEARPMRALGWISYSLYLWHMPVIDAARALMPQPSLMRSVVAVCAVLIVAAVSYLLIERPFQVIRWTRRPA